jgi:pimeloyl-ACP methyl ester carboxylesterase
MRRLMVLVVFSLTLLSADATWAQAKVGPCAERSLRGAECGSFPVPLDHSAPQGARLALKYVRIPAAAARRGVVVFLAGGPGQAATPLAASVADGPLRALRRRYDLVFLDQRGTGGSGPLRCSTAPKGVFRVDDDADPAAIAAAAAKCANELGARRAFYTTYETALDVENLREHLGVAQIVPLGVSYGGQVAGEYARRYAAHTQAVVLDSTGPIEGGDLLSALPQLALPRVLRETCFPPGCERLFADPSELLAGAVERMGSGGLRGTAVTPAGRPRAARIDVGDLYALVRASDMDPALRTAVPAALEAASRGDAAPLLRLAATAQSAPGEDGPGAINEVRLLATDCVEGRLPWKPDSDPATRPALLARAMRADAARYAPFPVAAVTPQLEAALCVGWPATPAPPRPASTGPDVPVLILGGRDDLRTPLEDQRRAGSQYPRATVVAVPNTGHSVLSSDLTGCARDAVSAFLLGRRRMPCPNKQMLPLALPVFSSLDDLPAASGRAPRRISQTAVAVDLTLRDVLRQVSALAFGTAGGNSDVEDRAVRIGGLRGGRLELRRRTLSLRVYEVVPGVRITGRLDTDLNGALTVTGTAATGTLTVGDQGLRGTLDGRPVTYKPLPIGAGA